MLFQHIPAKLIVIESQNPHIISGDKLEEGIVYEHLGTKYHFTGNDDARFFYKMDGKLYYFWKEELVESPSVWHDHKDRFVPRPDLGFEFIVV
jgi:hypothetical protein